MVKTINLDRALGVNNVKVTSCNIGPCVVVSADILDCTIVNADLLSGTFTKITGIGVQTVDLSITDKDVVTGCTTGSIVGKAVTCKVGFFGKAPVVQQTALTAADAVAIGCTYDATEATTMANMRTRINELESKLQALGLLA